MPGWKTPWKESHREGCNPESGPGGGLLRGLQPVDPLAAGRKRNPGAWTGVAPGCPQRRGPLVGSRVGGGPGRPRPGGPGAGHAPDRFGKQPAPAGSPGPLPPPPPRGDRVQLPGRSDGPDPHGQAGPGPPDGHPETLRPRDRPARPGPEPGSSPGNLDVRADVPAVLLPVREGRPVRGPGASTPTTSWPGGCPGS